VDTRKKQKQNNETCSVKENKKQKQVRTKYCHCKSLMWIFRNI